MTKGKVQPRCVLACYISIAKKDIRIFFANDLDAIKRCENDGYKKHDQKEILFKHFEVDVND